RQPRFISYRNLKSQIKDCASDGQCAQRRPRCCRLSGCHAWFNHPVRMEPAPAFALSSYSSLGAGISSPPLSTSVGVCGVCGVSSGVGVSSSIVSSSLNTWPTPQTQSVVALRATVRGTCDAVTGPGSLGRSKGGAVQAFVNRQRLTER